MYYFKFINPFFGVFPKYIGVLDLLRRRRGVCWYVITTINEWLNIILSYILRHCLSIPNLIIYWLLTIFVSNLLFSPLNIFIYIPSVITDPSEWRHFKMLHEVYTPLEENMFNLDTTSGFPEVFLRPKEKVNIPFKFLSFKADQTIPSQVTRMKIINMD